jgi:hypothetical protein
MEGAEPVHLTGTAAKIKEPGEEREHFEVFYLLASFNRFAVERAWYGGEGGI